MTASSVTGRGQGASDKLTTKELAALAVGPSIYAAGVVAGTTIASSPPPDDGTTSGRVTFPTPLPGGSDQYVILLTSLNGGAAYVAVMNDDDDGNFASFIVSVETDSDVMYLVVKKGFRPNV